MTDGDIPGHATTIALAVQPFGAVVVASPGTPHVTIVHDAGQASVIDAIIAAHGLRGERINHRGVKVFAA